MKRKFHFKLPLILVGVVLLVTCLSVLPMIFVLPAPTAHAIVTNEATYIQLTSGNWNDSFPVYSPNGQAIAFVSSRFGWDSLYLMRSDGSKVTSLFASSSIANISEPKFDPSGSQIAFVATWKNGSSTLFSIAMSGRELQQLAQSNGEIGTFSWSPDGSMIVFDEYRTQSWTIWLVNVAKQGSESAILPQDTTQGKNFDYRDPSWGPNGTWIVFSSNLSGLYSIWSYNLNSRNLERLTQGGNDSNPSTSPNGEYIAFARYTESNSEWTLWIADANGSDSHLATSSPQDQNPGVSWTPIISPYSYPTWNPSSNGVLFFSEQVGDNIVKSNANVFVYYLNVNVSVYEHIERETVQLIGDALVPMIYGINDINPSWGNGGMSIVYCNLGNNGQYHIWVRTLAAVVPKLTYG